MAGFIIILRIFCHRKKFSMQRVKLDLIDRKILTDLQADGRMTNVELAQRVGISAPPCLRRVRALEEAGYIRGYHDELNPQPLGYGVPVFALVGTHSRTVKRRVGDGCRRTGRSRRSEAHYKKQSKENN